MARPLVKSIRDIFSLSEAFEQRGGELVFTHSHFAVLVDDDVAYCGQWPFSKMQLTIHDWNPLLRKVPDDHVFPLAPLHISKSLFMLRFNYSSLCLTRSHGLCFVSAFRKGLLSSRTEGWIEESFTTSEQRPDVLAMCKLQAWMEGLRGDAHKQNDAEACQERWFALRTCVDSWIISDFNLESKYPS